MGFDLSHRLVQRNTLSIITHFCWKILTLDLLFFVFISPFWKIACDDPEKSFTLKSLWILSDKRCLLFWVLFKVYFRVADLEKTKQKNFNMDSTSRKVSKMSSDRAEDIESPPEMQIQERCRYICIKNRVEGVQVARGMFGCLNWNYWLWCNRALL